MSNMIMGPRKIPPVPAQWMGGCSYVSPGPTCRHAEHIFLKDTFVHGGTHIQNMAGQIDQHKQNTMPLPALAPSTHITMNTTGLILFLLCMEVLWLLALSTWCSQELVPGPLISPSCWHLHL